MEPLRIYTFGGLRILRGDQLITGLETRKVEALLVYLACNRRVHPREVLAELFWDERSQQQSQSNLRVALASLRKHLGEYLTIDRETAALNPEAAFWLDAAELEKGLSGWRENRGVTTSQAAEQVERALSLYQGEFLAGFYVREGGGFEDWQVRERERLHGLVVQALHDLVGYDLGSGALKEGLSHAARLLELDPLMEAAHRQMMALLARSGRRNEALSQYELLKSLLDEELGVQPSQATEDLVSKIRMGELDQGGFRAGFIRGYEIQEQAGAGTFGAVYRAYQPAVGREVAVKVILPQFANDAEFIRRFEAEAQIVARLEHPRIVPLYDYWREPDGAYLVMRYLRGGSLADELARGQLGAARAAGVIDQIAAALDIAHQQGIVHRDLKPENILLDENGEAYLSDFGIAKDLRADGQKTARGALVGSPVYMSPEQILSQPLTPQSDLFSLGVLLWELLAGELPYQTDSLAVLIQKQLNEPLPSLAERRPDLPAGVDAVIQRATAKNPADRFPGARALAEAFCQAIALGQAPAPPEITRLERPEILLVNPYKGLRPFLETDARDFFGRENLVQKLLARLSPHRPRPDGNGASTDGRFLAVVGPSGSGKSSVVRAGLVPALRRGAVPGSESWFIVDMLPGSHPLEELEAALLRVAVNPPDSLLKQLQEDERGLLRAVKRILPGSGEAELVLIVDQFEEVFTLVEEKRERQHFLDSLVAAVTEPRSPLRVVVTLRADFYDQPLMVQGFSELIRQYTEVVVPLSTEELTSAIRSPAEGVGANLEEGLVTAIVADVKEQPGVLPLLQYSLTELFERRQGMIMTRAAYEEIGGFLGALSRRAEELFGELNPAGWEAARQLFLRLVTLGEGTEDTRRRVLRSELETIILETKDDGWKTSEVIDAYGRYRLLSFDRDPATREPTVEVAHEALLREWGRLRDWLEESRDDLRQQRRLGTLTQEWASSGKDASFLLRGSRLEGLESWARTTGLSLTLLEREYLEASLAGREARQAAERAQQERQAALEVRSRRFLRALVVVLALATVVALALTGFALNRSQAAQQNARMAERSLLTATSAQGEALVQAGLARQAQGEAQTQAELAQQQKQIIETQAVEAQRVADTNHRIALAAQSQLAREAGKTDLALALAMAAIQGENPPAQAELALSLAAYEPGTVRVFTGHQGTIWSLGISPDGKYALSGGGRNQPNPEIKDYSLRLWDLRNGAEVWRMEGHSDAVTQIAFTPDSRFALSASLDHTLILWDVENGRVVRRLLGHEAPVWFIAISPDGKSALSASGSFDSPETEVDFSLRLWDLTTGEEIHRLGDGSHEISGLAFMPDGRHALSGTWDGILTLWDVETGRVTRRPDGTESVANVNNFISSLDIGPDGRLAALGSNGEELFAAVLWDLESWSEIRTIEAQPGFMRFLDISPDGTKLVTDDYAEAIAQVWDIESGKLLQTFSGHTGFTYAVAFTPDSQSILTTADDATLRLWTLEYGAVIRRFPHADQVRDVAYHPSDSRYALSLEPGAVHLWNLESGEEMHRMVAESDQYSIVYGPDGKTALSIITDDADPQRPEAVIQWDLESGEEIQRLAPGGVGIEFVTYSPDGRLALTSGEPAILWDLTTGEALRRFNRNTGSVAISPDGRRALMGGISSVYLWDLTTGEELRVMEGHTAIVRQVAFLPDGNTAVSGSWDGTLILWDLESGQILHHFIGHSGEIHGMGISPDGRTMISGSADGTLILWDLKSGQAIRRYYGHTWEVRDAAYSPDGSTVLSAGRDRQIILLRVDRTLEDLIAWTKANRYIRELTCSERALYQVEPLCEGQTQARGK